MKKNIFLLMFLLLIFISEYSIAQKPEKIYGKNRVLKTNEYYLQQMELWEKEVDKNPANADAWYNYYRADRNAYIVGEENDSLKSKGINRFERLQKIVLEMEKQAPKSYEYNFVKWLNGNNDLNLYPNLEKAHNLAPEQVEPLMSLIYYYEIKGDYTQRDKSIKACYNTGEYSPGLLNYSYNMLVGLEKDAIVFTEGDKDTDGTFLIQQGKGIRSDVKLINLNLLLIKEYRTRIFQELDIPTFELDPLMNDESYEKYRQTIIECFAKNKNKRPLYIAVTVSSPYTNVIKEKLYLTGLTYLYSTSKVDNLSLLKNNFEQLYAIDYLKTYLPYDISEGNVHRFNENYFLSLATLSNSYMLAGDNSKANYYKNIAQKIAQDSESFEEYEKYFINK